MSNNTQQRLASLDSSTTKALYKDLMINLWTTLLAGQGLISANRDAKADGNITPPEQEIINHQEQVFYSSVGLLAKNIASLASEVGLLSIAGTAWRGANNLMLFVDKLDGVPSDPRPHVDIALGIAIIADMEATLAEAIDWVSDSEFGKKIPPAVKVAGEVIGFASDFWSVIGNTMTDSSGNSLAVVYLDGGSQPKLPNLAEVLINIDYGQLMDDAEHRINNIIDAFLDYIPSLNPWEGQGEIKQKVFVGDKNSAGESDHFSGSEVGDIAYGLGGADSLFGNGGNDYLNGGKGNDYFEGGVGDDILIDSEGYDHYVFQGNFGHDIIYDQDGRGLIQINSISLSAGQKINDNEWQSSDGQYIISLVKDSDGVANFDSLFIHKNDDTENSITIKQWKNGDLGITLDGFGQTTNPNEGQYAFANDGNNVIFNERYVSSAGGNDLISSTDLNDIIMSGEGNDLIASNDGDDFIAAGDGNDIIFAGKGKDTIYGEKGDDLILSSSGMSSSRYSYKVNFDKENSTEDQLTENFDGLDFKYDPQLDENNRADSFYIHNANNVLTYQILPIFNIYYNSPYGKAYYYDILLSLNWGAGYAGGDVVYGGDGNDIITGSSDTDYIYGALLHKGLKG